MSHNVGQGCIWQAIQSFFGFFRAHDGTVHAVGSALLSMKNLQDIASSDTHNLILKSPHMAARQSCTCKHLPRTHSSHAHRQSFPHAFHTQRLVSISLDFGHGTPKILEI